MYEAKEQKIEIAIKYKYYNMKMILTFDNSK